MMPSHIEKENPALIKFKVGADEELCQRDSFSQKASLKKYFDSQLLIKFRSTIKSADFVL